NARSTRLALHANSGILRCAKSAPATFFDDRAPAKGGAHSDTHGLRATPPNLPSGADSGRRSRSAGKDVRTSTISLRAAGVKRQPIAASDDRAVPISGGWSLGADQSGWRA